MKRYLLIVMLLPCLIYSQYVIAQAPNGFGGLSFNTPVDSIRNRIIKMGYVPQSRPDGVIFYKPAKFGNNECLGVFLHFYKGRLGGGSVTVNPTHDPLVFQMFEEIIADITSKYGEPIIKKRDFIYPYSDKKDDWEMALKTGRATIKYQWYWSENNESNEAANQLVVSISDDFTVNFVYGTGLYSETTAKERDIKKTNDY